jgi:uncharacterized membrane protein YphA (DoxX/SURF4 family)
MMQSAPFNFRRIIIWIGRIVLAAIFIYAGYAKLFRPDMSPRPPMPIAISLFALQIDSYQILPAPAVLFVSRTLPFAEILLGLLLLIGWQLRVWATFITVIIAGFFASVVRAFSLGLQINCGCFAKPEPLTKWTVLRDGLLLLLAILMTVFAYQEARKPHPWTDASSDPPA